MASTRNINTPGNYCLEERQYQHAQHYVLYKNSAYGEAHDTKNPGLGLNPAQIPWNKMSQNSADIESFLFGINSTNLVKPEQPLTAKLIHLPSENLFEQGKVCIPNPLYIQKNQRPAIP